MHQATVIEYQTQHNIEWPKGHHTNKANAVDIGVLPLSLRRYSVSAWSSCGSIPVGGCILGRTWHVCRVSDTYAILDWEAMPKYSHPVDSKIHSLVCPFSSAVCSKPHLLLFTISSPWLGWMAALIVCLMASSLTVGFGFLPLVVALQCQHCSHPVIWLLYNKTTRGITYLILPLFLVAFSFGNFHEREFENLLSFTRVSRVMTGPRGHASKTRPKTTGVLIIAVIAFGGAAEQWFRRVFYCK